MMETKLKILIGLIWIGIVSSLLLGWLGVSRITYVRQAKAQEIEVTRETVTHAQEVWISALEWCESRGKPEAVNKVDRDGTPSYYSFQFKPGTFRYYAEKHQIIEKGLGDKTIMAKMGSQETQELLVKHLVNDKSIKWNQQFPDCVKKLGRPPVY